MPVQTVKVGLDSPKESVVSKEELIQSVLDALQQGQLETAAVLYGRSTEDIGYELMNKTGRGELARPLADVFLRVKDFYKAAQVFDRMDMKKEAAQNYEKAGDYASAAELYASIGELAVSAEMYERGAVYSRAAPLFEQAEKWLDAARNYAKSEEPFLAGRAFAKGGDEKKALAYLQKIPADDASYLEAVDILGLILERMGFTELAIEKYQGIVAGKGVTPENVKMCYRIARMQESSNRLKEARQVYAKILEIDLGYEDVQQRYRVLKEGAEVQCSASPAPPAAAVQGSPAGLIVLDEDMSLVEKSVIFKDLTFDERRSFLALAEKKAFKAGEVLLREGGALRGLGVIHHGTLGVGMKLEGKNIKLRRFGPGDHFGEMTICGARNARVTAIAETDGDYVLVTGERVGRFLEGNPTLAVKVLKNMMAAMDVHLDQFSEVVKKVWSRKEA